MKENRCLDLWPLCDYANATMAGWGKTATSKNPAPQVIHPAEPRRLLYAALGCELPIHESERNLAAFRAFFRLDRKLASNEPVTNDFKNEIEAERSACADAVPM